MLPETRTPSLLQPHNMVGRLTLRQERAAQSEQGLMFQVWGSTQGRRTFWEEVEDLDKVKELENEKEAEEEEEDEDEEEDEEEKQARRKKKSWV
jgi:hypothetical protein